MKKIERYENMKKYGEIRMKMQCVDIDTTLTRRRLHWTRKILFGFSPVAISITRKMLPHEILLWFPVHLTMLVQKLHDATLASLSVLENSRWRPRWSPLTRKENPRVAYSHRSLLKCSFYVVNIVIKIVLSFDTHVVI